MKYIKTHWPIPAYNMAMEDLIINHLPSDDYLTFYIHDPSIIVGQHQNTLEEINEDYVKRAGIHVQRRLSGGGAVYHDHGNLNFSFVVRGSREDVNKFDVLTRPVLRTLEKLGIAAELSGRNDLLIDGKKFSGNAQYFSNGRLLQHGTILFNSDMSELSKSLKVKDLKIQSKGVKSVRSRVTNIMEYLPDQTLTIEAFQGLLLETIGEMYPLEEYELSSKEKAIHKELTEKKFMSWDWNYGRTPLFTLQKVAKFPFGIVDVRMNIKKGALEDIKIYGDFFVKEGISGLENALKGSKYERQDLMTHLSSLDLEDYFKGMTQEEWCSFLLN
ncbi:Lipoate-protein ligase A [Clostridiaceae bacterium JG1575]|nr:Lipoate-protein ligase A [Clostridiaceae bacterium JG1575]